MKCTVLLFAFVLSAVLAAGQNLVPNPSFEEFTECPDSPLELDVEGAYPWTSFRGTPDFFHPCDESGVMSSPHSSCYGYGIPYHGVGKAGFISAGWFFDREVLAVPLISPLEIGVNYFISVQFLRTFGGGCHANCDCGVNNMGVKFTTQSYSPWNQIGIDNHAHLVYNEVISDSTNWTELSGWFMADSIYTHLAIGVFFDNDNITVENYNNYPMGYNTYYFVDAVCVTQDPTDCQDLWQNVQGTNHIQNQLIVFPNPTVDGLYVRSELGVEGFEILDMSGRVVRIENASGTSVYLQARDITAGMYILKVKFENGEKQHKSFIKR